MQDPKTPDYHMGSAIKLWWMQDWKPFINGGYLMPPIGGYYTHMSTTTAGRMLESHLRAKWAQPGTRKRDDHPGDVHRRICQCTETGPADCVTEGLPLPEMHDQAAWITEAPVGTPQESCGIRPRHYGTGEKDRIGQNWGGLLETVPESETRHVHPNPTEHVARTLRCHRHQYCMRIFAEPGEPFDVPHFRPQTLGVKPRGSINNETSIIGYVPPDLGFPNEGTNAVPGSLSNKAPPGRRTSFSSKASGSGQIVPNVSSGSHAKAQGTFRTPPWHKKGQGTEEKPPWRRSRSPRRRGNA